MRSPFEQFEIVRVGWLSNSGAIMLIGIGVILMLMRILIIGGGRMVPSRYGVLVEGIYKMIGEMVKENIGKAGERYRGIMMVIFMSILVLNMIGMVPYSYTVMAQIVVTLTISIGVWIGKLIIGYKKHGIRILGIFIPEGVPFGMVPVFVIIEIVGFIIPMISLAVRLFANMLSGHVLLKVLFSFMWSMFLSGGVMVIVHMIPLGVIMLLIGLEVCVGIIQAYVFTLLTCIYVGDMERGGH